MTTNLEPKTIEYLKKRQRLEENLEWLALPNINIPLLYKTQTKSKNPFFSLTAFLP